MPTNANGKICYIEIPATDIGVSARFYETVFGWKTRRRGDGALAFDDGVEVSGSWVSGRRPMGESGLLVYIMVRDLSAICGAIVANGGEVVERCKPDAPEIIARFRDPAGNLLGLYQERGLR